MLMCYLCLHPTEKENQLRLYDKNKNEDSLKHYLIELTCQLAKQLCLDLLTEKF